VRGLERNERIGKKKLKGLSEAEKWTRRENERASSN
jgi:hypothetical protein